MGGRGAANAAHRRGRLSASANGVHRHRGRTVVRPRRTALLPGERRYRMTTRVPLARNRVGVLASGAEFSPEGPLSQQSRTKTRPRRQILAGGCTFAADAYETFLPASFRRRKALLVRNPVGNPRSGVIGHRRDQSQRRGTPPRRFRPRASACPRTGSRTGQRRSRPAAAARHACRAR